MVIEPRLQIFILFWDTGSYDCVELQVVGRHLTCAMRNAAQSKVNATPRPRDMSPLVNSCRIYLISPSFSLIRVSLLDVCSLQWRRNSGPRGCHLYWRNNHRAVVRTTQNYRWQYHHKKEID